MSDLVDCDRQMIDAIKKKVAYFVVDHTGFLLIGPDAERWAIAFEELAAEIRSKIQMSDSASRISLSDSLPERAASTNRLSIASSS